MPTASRLSYTLVRIKSRPPAERNCQVHSAHFVVHAKYVEEEYVKEFVAAAKSCNVRGWISRLSETQVFGYVEGAPSKVEKLKKHCQKKRNSRRIHYAAFYEEQIRVGYYEIPGFVVISDPTTLNTARVPTFSDIERALKRTRTK